MVPLLDRSVLLHSVVRIGARRGYLHLLAARARLRALLFAASGHSKCARNVMVRNPILQLAVLVGVCLAATEMEVHDLSPNTLQAFATRRRRAMVLMYEKSCAATQGFQPWLFALAQMFPSLSLIHI